MSMNTLYQYQTKKMTYHNVIQAEETGHIFYLKNTNILARITTKEIRPYREGIETVKGHAVIND